MIDPDVATASAPEPAVAAFSDAETIDLVESWLRAAPDMRFGKVRLQGQALRLEITRRHFSEAKRRVGITAAVAPHPGSVRVRPAKSAAGEGVVAAELASPKPGPRRQMRRRRRPVNIADFSTLAATLEAIGC